jgi:hypothetical protein
MRRGLVIALAAVVATLSAPTALADKPVKTPAPFGEFTGQFCEDFAVRIVATTDQETQKVFSDGSVMITGSLKVDVTNLENRKAIALNISGPGTFTADGTTLIGTGRWLLFGEAGFFGRPGPTLELSVGRFTIDLATGIITSRNGSVRELCGALA